MSVSRSLNNNVGSKDLFIVKLKTSIWNVEDIESAGTSSTHPELIHQVRYSSEYILKLEIMLINTFLFFYRE